MQRDKLTFLIAAMVDKSELVTQYAKSQGFDSLREFEFSKAIGRGYMPSVGTVRTFASLGIGTIEAYQVAEDRMVKSGYASERNYENVLSLLQDEASGKALKKSANQVRNEREQKALAEKRQAEQAELERKAQLTREFPYYAVLSCSAGNSPFNIAGCFVGNPSTDLKIRNGSETRLFKAYDLNAAGKLQQGMLYIDLRKSFNIQAQNANENLILGIKIYERASNKVVFTDQAGMFGVIKVAN